MCACCYHIQVDMMYNLLSFDTEHTIAHNANLQSLSAFTPARRDHFYRAISHKSTPIQKFYNLGSQNTQISYEAAHLISCFLVWGPVSGTQ